MTTFVRLLSLALWFAVVGVIGLGVLKSLFVLVKDGSKSIDVSRRCVASGIVSALGLSTAIALLATTQLRSWNSIATFAATAALRTLVKVSEQFTLRHS